MPLEGSLESSGLGKGWTTSQNKDATSSYEEKTTRHTYQRRRRLFKGPTKVPERERENFKCLSRELDHHDFTSQVITSLPCLFPSLSPVQLWTSQPLGRGGGFDDHLPKSRILVSNRLKQLPEVESNVLIKTESVFVYLRLPQDFLLPKSSQRSQRTCPDFHTGARKDKAHHHHPTPSKCRGIRAPKYRGIGRNKKGAG